MNTSQARESLRLRTLTMLTGGKGRSKPKGRRAKMPMATSLCIFSTGIGQMASVSVSTDRMTE